MLILSEKDIRAIAEMAPLTDAMEDALRLEGEGRIVMPARLNVVDSETFLRIMPVIAAPLGVMGFKAFHGTSKSRVQYVVLLYSLDSGDLVAILDARYLTALRTGATTGVATKLLARKNAECVAVLGSGLEAGANLEGICAARKIRCVKIYSPTQQRRETFARRMSPRLGVVMTPVGDPREAVADADIVLAATNTGENGNVALRGSWLRDGTHVNAIGSTLPSLREVDEDVFRRATLTTLDSREQAEKESGDIIAAAAVGAYHSGKARVLGDMVAGCTGGRVSETDITVFKSVGTGIQDLAAASWLYGRATKRGVGRHVESFLEVKAFS